MRTAYTCVNKTTQEPFSWCRHNHLARGGAFDCLKQNGGNDRRNILIKVITPT